MKNALKELLDTLEGIEKTKEEIKSIAILLFCGYDDEPKVIRELDQLDFIYDDGYGQQELFGHVLFTDNTWLERREYDGAEGWVYKKTPVVEDLERWLEKKDVHYDWMDFRV